MNGNSPGPTAADAFENSKRLQLQRAASAIQTGDFDGALRHLHGTDWLRTKTEFADIWTERMKLRSASDQGLVDLFLSAEIPPAFRAQAFRPELYPNPKSLELALSMPAPSMLAEDGEPVANYRGGILGHGPTGGGKTRAMLSMLSQWVRNDPGLRFKYASGPVLKRKLADAARAGKSHQVIEELLEDEDSVLFIDDLSQSRFTASFAENLFELIDRIHREQRLLVVTVQTTSRELVRKWCADDKELTDTAQAIARRLREYCVPIHFPNTSRPADGTESTT